MQTPFLPHLLYLVIISFTCALIFVYPRTCAQVFCCMLCLRSIIRKSYCHVACLLVSSMAEGFINRLCGYVKKGLSTTYSAHPRRPILCTYSPFRKRWDLFLSRNGVVTIKNFEFFWQIVSEWPCNSSHENYIPKLYGIRKLEFRPGFCWNRILSRFEKKLNGKRQRFR